ncbi:MAG: haloacid dehalogenase-like hydrolase [Pedobacter sp.]
MTVRFWRCVWVVGLFLLQVNTGYGRQIRCDDPLSLWQDRPVKQAIVNFVRQVIDPADVAYVPPGDRIVTIDMDGTLLCERPLSVGMVFAESLLEELAEVPQLQGRQPFDAARQDRLKALRREHFELFFGMSGAGLEEDTVREKVRTLARQARHPRFDRPYRDLFYDPMLQLVTYLVRNDFIVYVLSGSDQTVVRTLCAERSELAGLPPSRFIGTLVALDVDYGTSGPVYYRLARELEPVNLRKGKALNILYRIGQKPILAVGNSEGDCGMLAATLGSGYPATMRLLLRHDDDEREYLYPRTERSGAADQAGLCQAQVGADILAISMKEDFRQIFGHPAK